MPSCVQKVLLQELVQVPHSLFAHPDLGVEWLGVRYFGLGQGATKQRWEVDLWVVGARQGGAGRKKERRVWEGGLEVVGLRWEGLVQRGVA